MAEERRTMANYCRKMAHFTLSVNCLSGSDSGNNFQIRVASAVLMVLVSTVDNTGSE